MSGFWICTVAAIGYLLMVIYIIPPEQIVNRAIFVFAAAVIGGMAFKNRKRFDV